MKITSTPPPVRAASSAAVAVEAAPPQDKFEKGFLQKAGDRVKFAAEEGLFCAGLAVATHVVPFAVTAALSRVVAPWVPYGGMVANLVLGGGLGAALGGVMHDRFHGPPRTEQEHKSRQDAMLVGGCCGTWSGFLGMAASPTATVDWAGLAMFGGTSMGVSAAVLAVPNFFKSLVKGPR